MNDTERHEIVSKTYWEKAEPYVLALIVFLAPIVVVEFAREVFNNIIEVGRIDMAFLPGASSGEPYPVPLIAASVISSLYNFGFALCGVMVFAVALTIYGSIIVWMAWKPMLLRGLFFLALIVAFVLIAVDMTELRITDHIRAAIAPQLIDGTLDYLPTCDPVESMHLARCGSAGIGNTGNSLQRVVAMAMGTVLVAGLAYLTAIAIVTGSSDTQIADRSARVENITLLAAMTFLLTIVAVHLLFQPGADMIAAAYGTRADAAPQLQNYAKLRSAMTLYWATIFSLALGTAYFTAATSIQRQAAKAVDFGGVWNVIKALLTVLSPVIADWVLKIGEAFGGAVGT